MKTSRRQFIASAVAATAALAAAPAGLAHFANTHPLSTPTTPPAPPSQDLKTSDHFADSVEYFLSGVKDCERDGNGTFNARKDPFTLILSPSDYHEFHASVHPVSGYSVYDFFRACFPKADVIPSAIVSDTPVDPAVLAPYNLAFYPLHPTEKGNMSATQP